jgi:hypothetical protein
MSIHHIIPATLVSLLALASSAYSQSFEATVLTDRIYKGQGVIDLLKNIEGNSLASYFNETGGLLLLGADLNENNSGNESNKSIGVAIKAAQLSISTTAGDFTFKDFFTGTTSMLRESGSSASSQYNTLFGQGGSSAITGKGVVDASNFDDILWFENIDFKGDITSAKLSVSFLETPGSKSNPTAAESFFDFSGGFEEFALVSTADAVLIEEKNNGMEEAPSGLKYEKAGSATAAIKEALAANSPPASPSEPAAPSAPIPSAPIPPSEPASGSSGGPSSEPAPATPSEPAVPSAPIPPSEPTSGSSGGSSSAPVSTPPAAPSPPLTALAAMGALLLWKKRHHLKSANA